MTEAMRDALELIRILKEQYPDEIEKRAVLRDVFNELLQELDEGKSPN
jgi:transcriptional regulator